ncbi:hypothetical protein NDU88_005000 [Pleurodeles waltl]|uniref:Uncharacterized protein n=1 Tax=Pleurodeles waltl TaxID=8319 RepID=A0AAV7V4P0_PLEWA|nr:hypothetical protein NDU88_005000 [Pleurodeles waltl]
MAAPQVLTALAASLALCRPPGVLAFNQDVGNPAVYTGPEGRYFGFSVDFYLPDAQRVRKYSSHSCDLVGKSALVRSRDAESGSTAVTRAILWVKRYSPFS